jgi:hypothetical protein
MTKGNNIRIEDTKSLDPLFNFIQGFEDFENKFTSKKIFKKYLYAYNKINSKCLYVLHEGMGLNRNSCGGNAILCGPPPPSLYTLKSSNGRKDRRRRKGLT